MDSIFNSLNKKRQAQYEYHLFKKNEYQLDLKVMDSHIVDDLNRIEVKFGNCHFIGKKSRENS